MRNDGTMSYERNRIHRFEALSFDGNLDAMDTLYSNIGVRG
jgi:hypothetical protein